MELAGESARIRTVGGPDYGDNMTDANTRIDSLKEDIREIGYTVLDLQARAAVHDSKLEQVLATQLAHDNRFDQIDVRLDGLENRFDGLENRFDGLENRFDGLEGRFDGLEGRFDGLENRFDGLENRFDGLENQVASQGTRFDRLDALLSEVLSRLSERP